MDAAAMQVHDMHLAEEEERLASQGARPSPSQSPPATGARRSVSPRAATAAAAATGAREGARTYAGAAAAGAAGGGNSEAPAAPRLAFYLNGKLLEPGTTIFQAVRAASATAANRNAPGASGSGSATAAALAVDGSPAPVPPPPPPPSAPGRNLGSRLWGDVHTLTYRPYEAAIEERDAAAAAAKAAGEAPMEIEGGKNDEKSGSLTGSQGVGLLQSPLAELLAPAAVYIDSSDIGGELAGAAPDCLDVLVVLSQLEMLNRLAQHLHAALEAHKGRTVPTTALAPGHVPREAFVSGRLGPKLSQQLKDVISICGGALPAWCYALASHARFLFPFEVRRRLFYCTSFGLARALLYLQQVHAAEHGPEGAADRDTGSLRSRVQRQKVRLSRNRILESAHRVFELYAGAKSQLEVEFFGEVGSGLGPTLEFYTLLSHELQRKNLGLWRDEGAADETSDAKEKAAGQADVVAVQGGGGAIARTVSGPGPLRGELITAEGHVMDNLNPNGTDQDLVSAPYGLFPRPVPEGKHRGATATAAKHFRLLGRVVAKALQDCRLLDLPLSPVLYRLVLGRKVDLFTLRGIDPGLSTSLERLHAAERAVAGTGRPAVVDGCPVEDLCLTFVLPGIQGYELCPGGADVAVTSENLRQYIDAVVDATLGSGVATQIEAFRTGFNAIFPLSSLEPFFEDEIEAMLCGTGEAWTPEGLGAVIKFDHGYTSTSAPVIALLEVLSELDAVDQRRFLRFVTGTPRLPPGGVASLQPRLTVVRKLSTAVGPGGELLGTSAPVGSVPLEAAAGSMGTGGSVSGGGVRNLADGDLPSVMTCANYLKLPPYSSKEVLRERLLFAVREGQGSFDLS